MILNLEKTDTQKIREQEAKRIQNNLLYFKTRLGGSTNVGKNNKKVK